MKGRFINTEFQVRRYGGRNVEGSEDLFRSRSRSRSKLESVLIMI